MSTPIYKDFIDNKYYRTYIRLLSKPDITTEYTEEHHILPRSLGGLDSKENLVRIISRKHFIAHYLLTKFTKENTPAWHSMIKAFNMMSASPSGNIRYMNSRLYASNRKRMSATMSLVQSGKNNSQFGSSWFYNPKTKENIKLKKGTEIPQDWVKGRVTNWDTHFSQRKCCVCGVIGCMSLRSTHCSKLCYLKSMSKNSKLKRINTTDFITDYIIYKSLRKVMGLYSLSLGNNVEWCRDIILNSGNFEAICIFMSSRKAK